MSEKKRLTWLIGAISAGESGASAEMLYQRISNMAMIAVLNQNFRGFNQQILIAEFIEMIQESAVVTTKHEGVSGRCSFESIQQ